MKERANAIFPFAIACALPPAGVLLGLVSIQQEDRDTGLRLIVVSIIAAAAWVAIVLSLQ
jgi:hypothetical protein